MSYIQQYMPVTRDVSIATSNWNKQRLDNHIDQNLTKQITSWTSIIKRHTHTHLYTDFAFI